MNGKRSEVDPAITLLEAFEGRRPLIAHYSMWQSGHPGAEQCEGCTCLDALLVGPRIGMMHLVCYLRDGDRVFETYWTWHRGAEVMGYNYAPMDLTVYGRQEPWESPPGRPQPWPIDSTNTRPNGRLTAQWPRDEAGLSDDLATTSRGGTK
jgi:predicted dithiol-disulfide oxidoreductase (DUF899 family)